ncbi:MAG: hypothetical protein M3N53_03940 [Actinomycetota bacterium]|nr:hypothetical protein [Actinomycetota bacterium]
MTHLRRRVAGVLLCGSLLFLPACDTDPAEQVPQDPEGPIEDAPGNEGPDTQAESPTGG